MKDLVTSHIQPWCDTDEAKSWWSQMSRLRCGSASWDGGCWHRTWTDTLHCDKRCSCDGGRVGRWRHSATVSERSLIRADKRERRMCCKLISHRHSWVYSVSRMWVFLNRIFLQGGVVSTSPNPQISRKWWPFMHLNLGFEILAAWPLLGPWIYPKCMDTQILERRNINWALINDKPRYIEST